MGASATAGMQMVAARPCVSPSQRILASRASVLGFDRGMCGEPRFGSSRHVSSVGSLRMKSSLGAPLRCSSKVVTRAMSEASEKIDGFGLPIDLRGKFQMN